MLLYLPWFYIVSGQSLHETKFCRKFLLLVLQIVQIGIVICPNYMAAIKFYKIYRACILCLFQSVKTPEQISTLYKRCTFGVKPALAILLNLWRVGTLTTNRRPLTVSVVVFYEVGQQFYVGPDRFIIRDVFLSVFDGSVVTISVDKSTRSHVITEQV